MKTTNADYGWLSPSGKYYEVDWGGHQTWAEMHIKEVLDWESLPLKYRIWSDGMGDILMIYGWVLLHNPTGNTAFPTKKPEKRYTKAQAEFLYNYYIERGENDMATQIIHEYEG